MYARDVDRPYRNPQRANEERSMTKTTEKEKKKDIVDTHKG